MRIYCHLCSFTVITVSATASATISSHVKATTTMISFSSNCAWKDIVAGNSTLTNAGTTYFSNTVVSMCSTFTTIVNSICNTYGQITSLIYFSHSHIPILTDKSF
ncbi:unnamed protein product [Ilex paraguariensis]|uniref:Uncharacterized protein n=1 Tax=Ilex paraguariensis TaxID=185542 RepID=A0ABC8QZ45_9AQUA